MDVNWYVTHTDQGPSVCVTARDYQSLATNMAEILSWITQASYVMETAND